MNIRISWHMLGLAAVFAAAVIAAILELGPPTSSARTTKETITAATGLVQSTVTGTGNLEPGTDDTANFQTSGTLQNVYVKAGDHVVKGQLLATLDPTAAQLTVDQAQENLTSAQDNLTNAEDQTTTSSTGTSLENVGSATEFVSYKPPSTTPTTKAGSTTTTPTTTTSPTTVTETVTSTTPTGSSGTRSGSSGSGSSGSNGTTGSASGSSGSSGSGASGSSGSGSSGSSRSGSSSSGGTSTTSAETIAANIASAQASVDSAEASLQNAETALHETHLYAPATGTVVSVQDISPGDEVSSSGSGSSSGSSSASSASSSSAAAGSSSAGSLGGSSGSSGSSSSSSSSGFVEIVNSGTMTMTVAFSESDVAKVKVGQPATVTLDALTGVELGAHVTSISTLGTTSNSVVSYDATLTLDQRDSRVKPGMSASASVITGQASGVNLPTSAVTGTSGSVAHVNVLQNGKTVSTPVVVGVVGDTRTQIVSGLHAGQQVVVTETLPSLSTSSSSGSSSSGTLGGTQLGGGAARLFGGGGGGFAGGGFARGG